MLIRKTHTPFVSVVIPCFNHAHFVRDAIDSVLQQTYPQCEVLLIDDGSTDDTPAVAAEYGNRISYVRQPNCGLSAARNAGIRAARGEWFLFLDSDDWLTPDMIARLVEAAQQSPEAGILIGACHLSDQQGSRLEMLYPPRIPRKPYLYYLKRSPMPPCCYFLRRCVVAQTGFFDESLAACADWDYWIRAAAEGFQFRTVSTAVACYRRYGGSMSRRYELMWREANAVLDRQMAEHGERRDVRRAVRVGKRSMRMYCAGEILLPELHRLLRNRQPAAAIRAVFDMLACDPQLLPAATFWAVARARRKMWRPDTTCDPAPLAGPQR